MNPETTLLKRALHILSTKEKYEVFKKKLELEPDRYTELEFVLAALLILNDTMDYASKAATITREFCTLKFLKHYRQEEDVKYVFDAISEFADDKEAANNIRKHIHTIFFVFVSTQWWRNKILKLATHK